MEAGSQTQKNPAVLPSSCGSVHERYGESFAFQVVELGWLRDEIIGGVGLTLTAKRVSTVPTPA